MEYLALSLTCAIWVLFDGLSRRAKVLPWVLGVAMAGPILMAVYLAKRPLRRGEIREGGVAWNILKNLVIFWTLLMLVVAISAAAELGEHSNSLAFMATTLSLGMIAGIWFFPFIGAVGIAFLVKKSSIIEEGPTGRLAGQTDSTSILISGWVPWAAIGAAWLVLIAGTVALRSYKIRRAEVFPQTQPSQPQTTTPPDVTLVSTLAGHTDGVESVAFSPDGRSLASCSGDNTIKLWEVATGRELRTLVGHTWPISSVAFSPDGRTLASGTYDGTIKLWEVASGHEVRTLTGKAGYVKSVAFSPDGRTLASASCAEDKNIRLWEVATGRELRTLPGPTKQIFSVAFSPDVRTVAWGTLDMGTLDNPTITLWEVDTGRELRTLAGLANFVKHVAFSPDGRTLASGGYDTTIKLWDVTTGHELRTLAGHTNWVTSVAFSPGGRTLASGAFDGTIMLWDVATGRELRTLTGHAEGVYSVAFSPDGRTLASGSSDKTIKLWRWQE